MVAQVTMATNIITDGSFSRSSCAARVRVGANAGETGTGFGGTGDTVFGKKETSQQAMRLARTSPVSFSRLRDQQRSLRRHKRAGYHARQAIGNGSRTERNNNPNASREPSAAIEDAVTFFSLL